MDQGFNPGSAREIINFQVRRNISALFKSFLVTLEDIDDGIALDYERQRKRVLDLGNEAIREIQSQLDLFDVDYKR